MSATMGSGYQGLACECEGGLVNLSRGSPSYPVRLGLLKIRLPGFFIQDFFNWGGGGGPASCSATVQPPTLHEVGWGELCQYTDLIGPVGSGGLPIITAHQIYYRKSESMSEILGFVTYFRGGSRILQGRGS